MQLAIRVLEINFDFDGVCLQCHTWLRKWHSLADFATTREEKIHETRMMLSAKYTKYIRVQYLKYTFILPGVIM